MSQLRGASWRRAAVVFPVLLAGILLVLALPVEGLIKHTITVDGNVSDWGDVLTDPENVVSDLGSFSDPPDPDMPGTADRDLRGVAFTWDATNLYIFFRRTLSGNSSFEFLLYMDLDHDELLEATDRVVRLGYNGASFQQGQVYGYVPASPGGDALTGDGVDQPGSLGALLSSAPFGANSPDGIEFEARIPWTSLGVAPGTCMFMHPAISRGLNLPSQVEDNTDPLDTQDVAIRVEEDRRAASASPGQVDHAHRACNDGNCTDTVDLTARSNEGWALEFHSDPNGDGDPSDGQLLGLDANGDGDFSDTLFGDFLLPAADSNDNNLLDTGPLAPGTCFSFVVRVLVPPGVAPGTMDVERVRGRSATRPQDLESNLDETHVGPIVVFSDEEATVFAGDEAWIPHVACNMQGAADTLDLFATSLLGWTVEIWSDPNGDGHPADGAPISAVALLAGECTTLLLHALVPGGEPPGSIDEVTVTARSQASPSIAESALDTLTVVAEPFSVTPDHVRQTGPGDTLFLPHQITNHLGAGDSFALSAVSGTPGYTLTLLTDPDGDGEPNDSVVIPNGGTVGPIGGNGESFHFLLRVDVPQGAVIGSDNVITVTATSVNSPAAFDTATDIVQVRRLLTYSDPLFARPSSVFFTSCATVHAQAHGLQTNRQYRFVWTDPAPVQQRLSPAYSPDALGRSDDAFSLPCGIVPGTWTVRLQIRSGSTWTDVPGANTTFTTYDPAVTHGDITRLETDQPLYDRDGDDISVESTLDNDTQADYLDTFADYVIFRDANGDGVPTAGESFILGDGSLSTWSAGEYTHRTEPIRVFAEDSYEDYFIVPNADFQEEGTWCVWERWAQICPTGSCSEVTIDTKLLCFLVSCIPAPLMDAGANRQACAGEAVALADATSNGDTHQWSDGGAGGSFSPSATDLNASYSPPGVGTYTLTLVSSFTATGCSSQDQLTLIIHPNPVMSAGPDATTCAGDPVALGAATSDADTFLWDDGGAGGSFAPSSSAPNPTYTPPDPSPATITLTLACTQSATGCDSVDSLTLTVNSNPVMSAGPDATTCAGDPVTLGDATSDADTYLWDDGGAGGSFAPSSSALNPAYTPPDPSPASITLTLTSTHSATGCDSVDSLTLAVDPNPVMSAGPDATTCAGGPVTLGTATSDGDTHLWDDGGAGGAFAPSASALNPTYTPADPSPASITLTLTSMHSATGCDSTDSLTLTVNPNPVMSAGPDATTCAGDPVMLGDATSDADTHLWDDGGAGGSFAPSASALNPTYTPPDPSPATITLSLASTHSATGCDSVDALTLTVNPNPVVEAGLDATTCAGDPITLGDATSDADTHLWDDGGAGGSFAPSASALNPTYTPLDPSPLSITLTLTSAHSATGCDSVDSLTLTVNPNPVMSAGPDATTCAGDPVTLGAATSDADTFLWDDGGAGGSFAPSASALNPTYTPLDPSPLSITLTLTSTHSATVCDSVDSLTLTVNPGPVVSAGPDATTCAGDPVTLGDATSDADTYLWDDGGAGGSFAPSSSALNPDYTPPDPSPASITLTLTSTHSATGCDSMDSLTLSVNVNPVINAGPDVATCAGDPVTLADATSDADTFAWDDGGAGGSFAPSASALNPVYTPSDPPPPSITLTLTSTHSATGCDSVDSLALVVSPMPVVSAGPDVATCAGDPVMLGGATSDADTHLWSDGGAGGSFAPSASALNPTYTPPDPSPATITLSLASTHSATGCDSVDALTLTVNPNPLVDAGPPASACLGQTVSLAGATAAPADEFAWSDGGAGGAFLPNASALNPTYSNPTPGTYTLTLTASVLATGCTAQDTRTVTIHPLPSVNAGPDLAACQGLPMPLAGATSDGDTFAWSDGGAGGTFAPSASVLNPTYSNAAAGAHVLTLVATEASTGCSASDTLTVTLQPQAIAAFAVPPSPCEDADACFDDLSVGATSWLWEFGDAGGSTSTETEPCFRYADPGTYMVRLTVTNACGSDTTQASITVAPKPVAEFSYSTQGNRFCRDKNVSFTDLSTNSPTSWQWNFGDGNTSTAQNPVHAYATDGIFLVSLIACNACGCSAPHFEAIEIAATCNTNCEANSNQVGCQSGTATFSGNTCTNHDNFNTTSYPCAPGLVYSGNNKTYDLNFIAGSNFIITLTETVPEPNGYDLDLMVSVSCNPPECAAWGDTQVVYDDRTPENDDFWVIVDGRDGTCGPFTLTVQCLAPDVTTECEPPDFAGVLSASDPNPCTINGILVEWIAAADWGLGLTGEACTSGVYEIRRAPASSPADEMTVGTALPPATSFVDANAVPGVAYIYRVHAINDCCGSLTLTTNTATGTDVFAAQPVTANAGPDRVLTCALPTATLLGTADGGTGGGYSYLWSPTDGLSNPAISNPTVSQAGTYTLTVTDVGNGCTDTDTVVVTGQVPPTTSAGPDRDITCTQPVVMLQGSASGGDGSLGYTFSWTPAAGLSDPSAATPTTSTAGTYTLEVLDIASGCSSTDSVIVADLRVAPTASAGPDGVITCAAPGYALQGSASGGDGRSGYTFEWSPAAGLDDPASATPLASLAGTWSLVVTDAYTGCVSVADTVTVTANQVPPVAGAGPDRMLTCLVPQVTLDGSASGGDGSLGYTFSWSPPENLSDPTAEDPTTLVPGTYTLTVTALANGCIATDTVEVVDDPNRPRAHAGPDADITCLVTGVTLQGSASAGDDSAGYAYHWEPAGQVSDPDIAQPTTSTPGTYTLTITTLADGCEATDVVVVADLTAAPVASAGADAVLTCMAPSLTLQGEASGSDGRAGWSFRWEPAGLVSDPDIAQPTTSVPGIYTLTVTDNYTGCVGEDTVSIAVDQAAPVVGAGADRLLTCTTTVVTLEGVASGGNGSLGYAYSWEPPAGLSDPSIAQPTTSTPGTWTLTATDLANGCTSQDIVVVTQDVATPVASAGPDRVLTCTSPLATLAGTASGGNGTLGYAYSWTPAAGLSDPSIAEPTTSTPGTWTLTITDLANGCTANDSVTVTDDTEAPVVSAGPDGAITCTTPVATLLGTASGGNGSLGYAFSWTPAAGLSNPSVPQPTTSTPGTYTLTVTDVANGCVVTDMVTIADDDAPPVASAGPNQGLTCATTVVALEGSASGGNGSLGYAFSWEPAAGLSDPSIAQPTTSTPGTWTLTVTDLANGCTAQDSVTVGQDLGTPVASAGPDQVLTCATPLVTLAGTASGGNGSLGYAFSWAPAAGLSSPFVAQPTTSTAGTWQLTVTDLATGCTATDLVTVSDNTIPPVAQAGGDRVLDCDTASVLLAGAASGGDGSLGYAYSWTPVAGLSDPSSDTPTATLPATYTLEVTDLATGCTGTDQVIVTQDLAAPSVSAGADRALDCTNPTAILAGTASGGNGSLGYAVSWAPATGLSDPSSLTPVVSAAGSYTLTVTDLANGCTSQDTVIVTSDMARPVVSAGPDAVLDCRNPMATLTGSVSGGNGSLGYALAWEPAGGVADPDALVTAVMAAGTYTLTATDLANGCTASDTVVVTSTTPTPVANAGPDGAITCAQAVAILSGSASGGDGSLGYEAEWSPAAGVADPSALSTTTTMPGTYTLLITDIATGCQAVDSVVVADGRTPPNVDAGPGRQLDCTSQLVTLQGSATGGDDSQGRIYAWSPPANVSDPAAPAPTTSLAGTYTLTVTDRATGCSAIDTVVVTSNTAAPVASAGPDLQRDCRSGNVVVLTGAASGGDGSMGYAYSWSPAAGLDNPVVAEPSASQDGTWTLTITDLANGCTAVDSVTVTSDFRVPVANAGPDAALGCLAPLADLAGSASGGNGSLGYEYRWEPAGDVVDPDAAITQATAPGTFTLVVTDLANGCEASDFVIVTPAAGVPTADAGPDRQLTCATPTATLSGSASGGDGSLGYVFRWEPAAGVADPDTQVTTTSTPGSYVLTVTDVATGCQASDTVIVQGEQPPVADAGQDDVVSCLDTPAQLSGSVSGGDGSLGFAYAWEPAADVADPTAATTTTAVPGRYTLTVTDIATGCRAVDTVTVLPGVVPVPLDPSALDARPGAPPLRVSWMDPRTRAQLHLTWEDVGAFEYRVHAGSIANFMPRRGAASYDHAALACGLVAPELVVAPPAGPAARYFIAVAANCAGVESSYGRDSLGAERPDAATASGNGCP